MRAGASGSLPEPVEGARGGPDKAVHQALVEWRHDYAGARGWDARNVCSGNMLQQLARVLPTTVGDLSRVSGMNAQRIEAIGADVLAVVAAHREPAETGKTARSEKTAAQK